MSINIKKYTKDQMAKMVEDAQAKVQKLRRVNAALTEQISQMNGESINKANEIANLKADAEETLGRTRSVVASMQGKLACANDEIVRLKENLGRSESRANWAASHPWSNLWAWIKRKLFW